MSEREVAALAAATGMSPAEFTERHTTSAHGETVLRDRPDTDGARAGDCEWLERDDDGTTGCRVQSAKPDQCAAYPFWPRILRHRGAWEAEGVACKGIGQGPTIPPAEIERRSGTEKVFEDLDELMSDLDAEVQGIGVVCWLRGQCCDFEAAGHRLYASRMEAERFAAGIDLTGWDPDSGLCPAWKDRRCTAREGRPSACRTYFCDPDFEEATGELTERYVTRLKWLHDKHGRRWEYRDWIAHLADLKHEGE